MTDKRFQKMTHCDSYLIEDETTVYKLEDIVAFLNDLHEENERLKTLNNIHKKQLEAYVNALNKEYEKATGELKEALGKVMKTKYEVI